MISAHFCSPQLPLALLNKLRKLTRIRRIFSYKRISKFELTLARALKGDKIAKLYIAADCGKIQIDLYCATPLTFGIHKLIRTGSAEHNIWLASYAMSKGFRLRYGEGLLKDGRVVAGETEEGVFEALGLKCPEPEEREVVDRKPVWL